jgi:hypothetical protein
VLREREGVAVSGWLARQFVHDSHGEVLSRTVSQVYGGTGDHRTAYPYQDVLLRPDGSLALGYLFGRFCVVGHKLFEIAVGSTPADRHAPEAMLFVNSFSPLEPADV